MNRVVLFIIAIVAFASYAVGGEITGKVQIKDASDSGNAVVYIENQSGMRFTAPTQEPLMDQKNLRFVPHVLPVQVGTTVRFKNSDPVVHNIFTPSPAGDMFNLGSWKGDEVKMHTFDKTGEVVLLCNLHPEMEGFIYVTPTPYFAKTDASGEYTISNVPAGTYTLNVWAENGNTRPQQITVPGSGSVNANFSMR